MAHKEYGEGGRITIVVNKWWECNPVLEALLNSEACPADLGAGNLFSK